MQFDQPLSRADVVSVLATIIGSLAAYQVVFFFLKRRAKADHNFAKLLQQYIYFPGLFLIFVVSLIAALPFARHYFSDRITDIAKQALVILAIGGITMLVMRIMTVFRETTLRRYKSENPHDFTIRKAKTKFQLIQRVLNFLVITGGISAALMTFESVRQVGGTLLASAGVIGLVLGFAAQKSLGTLFAGIQIAISQPIRTDDTVVVEGQFGTIGEITLTYVVVNTWDGRRLIVPINYFLEETFENWTRASPEVVGQVKVYADYSLPVEKVRQEVKRWIEASPLWDKRTWGFLVTDATEKTIQVRVTMSAKDSGDAWDLQCHIREKLITHIRQQYPHALPRARVDIRESSNGKPNFRGLRNKPPREKDRNDGEWRERKQSGS